MTTAVDTNVVIGLWDKDAPLSLAAQNALDAAFKRGTLVAAAVCGADHGARSQREICRVLFLLLGHRNWG